MTCHHVLYSRSGFTALTERLAKRGPNGAEELVTFLNEYFGMYIIMIQYSTGALISRVRLHGGDVMKFAGDALVALWPGVNQVCMMCIPCHNSLIQNWMTV